MKTSPTIQNPKSPDGRAATPPMQSLDPSDTCPKLNAAGDTWYDTPPNVRETEGFDEQGS
jgi:hypothetical protein